MSVGGRSAARRSGAGAGAGAGVGEEDEDEDFDDGATTATGAAPTAAAVAARRSAARAAAAALHAAEDAAMAAQQERFPDEVDTPLEVPARVRFARYRGLKSFRTSPWDPRENLPPAYARVFSLPHFLRTQRRLLAEAALTERTLVTLEARKLASEREGRRGAAAEGRAARAAERRGGSASNAASAAGSVRGAGSAAVASASASASAELDYEEDGEEDGMADGGASALGHGGGGGGRRRSSAGASASASSAAASAALSGAAARGALGGRGGVASGQFVTLRLSGVPRGALRDATAGGGAPLTAWSLLRHENRASVCHFNLARTPDFGGALKSREQLEFLVGPRLFDARPVFSDAGQGGGKCRALRFLAPGRACLATAYAPILFAPYPVLVFKRVPVGGAAEGDGGGPAPPAALCAGLYPAPDRLRAESPAALATRRVLVATGSVAGADPDRVLLKRVILSGFPVKVKRTFAMVQCECVGGACLAQLGPPRSAARRSARATSPSARSRLPD